MIPQEYWKRFGADGQDQVFLSHGDKKGYIITRICDDIRIKGMTFVEDEDHAVAAYSGWVRYFQRKAGNPEGILPK